jgi:NAD(P)-dependent dehydrogenase (short-subunit alcohol dehydrogenase family)
VSSGAVVTGAAGGLGLEIARVLARRGLTVHLTDVDGDVAETAAAQLDGATFSSTLDVRDFEACRAAARATVERAGSLAVWVNNAGLLFPGPAWEQDEAQRRLTMDVNALGTINGTLAALEVMRPAGSGRVINVVSLAGLVAPPGEAVYAASKHAAIAFSLGTLSDLRRAGAKGIEISCLCPDGIWTPMLHDKLDDPNAAASFFGTMLLPEQVAERVGHLIDKPRPVVAMPRYRGAFARAVDLTPRLLMRLHTPTLALARAKQRRIKRKLQAGSWPPPPDGSWADARARDDRPGRPR